MGRSILCSICKRIRHIEELILTDKSWDLHIRKKRIIDKTPDGNKPVKIENVPYIVGILKNGAHNCGGSILTSSVILTAAHCVFLAGVYTVLSGSALVNKGQEHKLIGKLIHHLFRPKTNENDLALLSISPSIDLIHSPNRRIELHLGNLPEKGVGTLSGWGSIDESGLKPKFPKQLRSIVVPYIKLEKCEFYYAYPQKITAGNICTHDIYNKKFGSVGDSGGPLVVGGKLVGVLSWSRVKKYWENPDVFINVAYPLNRNWVIANVRIIEEWN